SFWSEIYETVLAWYIAPPTLVALINPHKGKFNVTAKGGLVEEEYVDWVISRPYIFLVLLNLVGVAVGIWRYFYGPPTEMLTVVVSMVWVFYNLIVLGGAVAVSVESKQVRRRGYTSAYMRIPQAAGLATESLSAHIGQRIRWARGMVQIFRLDNPLTGKGLKFAQRLCYVNAMFHFLSGIPRLIFLTAPLAFLLLHAYIIYAPALMIALFVLPHMIHASLTNSKIQGKYRH
ncbi:hypothetical protein ACX3VG_14225, partial [Escherichia coli]